MSLTFDDFCDLFDKDFFEIRALRKIFNYISGDYLVRTPDEIRAKFPVYEEVDRECFSDEDIFYKYENGSFIVLN